MRGIEGIDPPERMRVRKLLRERSRRTRDKPARYVLESYEQTGVPLPVAEQRRRAA